MLPWSCSLANKLLICIPEIFEGISRVTVSSLKTKGVINPLKSFYLFQSLLFQLQHMLLKFKSSGCVVVIPNYMVHHHLRKRDKTEGTEASLRNNEYRPLFFLSQTYPCLSLHHFVSTETNRILSTVIQSQYTLITNPLFNLII